MHLFCVAGKSEGASDKTFYYLGTGMPYPSDIERSDPLQAIPASLHDTSD
jgi:hypothetical protein